jgi:lysophospholipase L1-like esterase
VEAALNFNPRNSNSPGRYVAALVFICTLALSSVAYAQPATHAEHWVSAWSTAVQTAPNFPGLPPVPVFENQTIRMVVRPTLGATRVRVRLSNAFGTAPLKIGTAQVALAGAGSALVPNTTQPLTFNGSTAITIPTGASMLSDPVSLKLSPLQEVAISLYVPEQTTGTTMHFWGQHDTYTSEPGDFTSKSEMPIAWARTSWYFLSGLEVVAPGGKGATVTFGDSITDGAGAKQGDYLDWPDLLANRIVANERSPRLAVVNEGIGGNRVLHDAAGVNALARLDRDVLAQPGVVNLIVLEGINDLGWPHMKPRKQPDGSVRESPFTQQLVTAKELITGLSQIVERSHQHGIRVFGATILPYEGADYYTPEEEQKRQQVNQWIRTSGAFDGVIDFDSVTRDPEHPGRMRAEFDSGDHLHPSAAGYNAMAAAIDIHKLNSGTQSKPAENDSKAQRPSGTKR